MEAALPEEPRQRETWGRSRLPRFDRAIPSPAPRSDAARSGRRLRLARNAEQLVAEWLRRRGFEILERNVRLGRLELDLVARRGSLLIFCEVRARTDGPLGVHPAETVGPAKRERLRRAAALWLQRNALRTPCRVRLDVAAVRYPRDGSEPRIDYYPGAF